MPMRPSMCEYPTQTNLNDREMILRVEAFCC